MIDQVLHAATQALMLEFFGPPENQGRGSPYAALDARRSREEIGAVMVLADLELCDRLIGMGITGSTGAALALVPVIEVAWADGKVQQAERLAILGGGHEIGFTQPECHALLEHWLTVRPSPRMITAWTSYVRALARVMPEGDRDELRDALIELARGVAKAAGGVAGFGKISGSENKVLEHVRATFDGGS